MEEQKQVLENPNENDSAGENNEEPAVVYLDEETKAMYRQMHQERNVFTFSGKGGIIISSDFESGNLAACD